MLVKLCPLKGKKIMLLVLEIVHLHIELPNEVINPFKVVFLKGIELLLRPEDLNELEDPSLEDIELPEDLGLTKVEVVAPREILDLLLDNSILLLIGLVEFDT